VLQDLQRSTGRSIVFSIFTICLVLFFAVVIPSPFSWTFWLVMGVALSSCARTYLLLNRYVWISHIVLIAGPLDAIGLATVYFHFPVIILLCAFLPMLSAIAVGCQISLISEAAVLGLFLLLSEFSGISCFCYPSPPLSLSSFGSLPPSGMSSCSRLS
jgi:hypothetical protein